MENQKSVDEEFEIDLRDILLELLGFWKIIIVVAILVGAIAFSVSKFLIIPEYESTAVLYVLTKSTSITSLADIQTGTSLTNDYLVVVKGRPVLDQVIENLGLSEDYDELKDKVTLNNPSNSRLLEITVKDKDPNRAKKIADEIATISADFIQVKMKQDAPTITQKGYADGNPVSPDITKNTMLGFIFGGVAASGLIIVSYLLNDSISDPEDIEKKLGLNVLGTLPYENNEDDGENTTKKKRSKKIKK